jgi:Holliday junction resolvase RusA-like endonuclease
MTPNEKHAMQIELLLPFPPSTNRLWELGVRKMFNSKAYRAWKAEAAGMYWQQYGGGKKRPERLDSFKISIVLDQNRRARSDGDNRIKCVLDFCQSAGLVLNDAGCDGGSWSWGIAPTGCRVVLTGEPAAAKP